MNHFFQFLFDTSQWPPRWRCGNWTDALGYTHIISDTLIFGAYFAIPCILVYLYFKIQGFKLEKVFGLFALFILCCGTGHLVEAIIFYYPVYRFAGAIKVLTAIVSWMTVFALIPYLKMLVHVPKMQLMNRELLAKLEKTNKELKESEDTLKDFAYHAAHDLKEPVRGMSSYAFILLDSDEYQLPEEVKEKLTKIVNLSARSQLMIDNMLKYSTGIHKATQVELCSVENILNELMQDIQERDKSVDIKILSKIPNMWINETLVKEVIKNLLENAVKYNDSEKKIIKVGYKNGGDKHIIYVNDNGQGIHEDDKKNIFNLFYRGKNAKKNNSTGLGLGIVKKYIEKSGGKAWVESQKSVGSTFYISLPKEQKPIVENDNPQKFDVQIQMS
ncbi:MAG: HAMP domain-containing sensor histidine kinase [Chlamydiota bacterium]|nr:HAMP domain-containing sensor histidine kinase [Chlamydiota bacterium]